MYFSAWKVPDFSAVAFGVGGTMLVPHYTVRETTRSLSIPLGQGGILRVLNHLKKSVQPFTVLPTLSRTYRQKCHYGKTPTRENKTNEHVSPLAADTNSPA